MRRIYYGWFLLYAVSIGQVVSWGILYYGFSVFILPMSAELGWSQVELTGGFSIALFTSGLAAVPVGLWIDRHGTRLLMSCGSILAVLMLLCWAWVQHLLGFYLLMAGIGIAMAAVLYDPAFAIAATWFVRKRSQAFTILTFFGALASFVFIPLTGWLIAQLGWRMALVALAAILGVITIPLHALMLRRFPEDLGLFPDGADSAPPEHSLPLPGESDMLLRRALRGPTFWWLATALGLSVLAALVMTVGIIPYLIEQGHDPQFAALLAGMHGLMSLFGRMLLLPLGDRFSRRDVSAGLMLFQMLGLILLALMPSSVGAFLAVALFGMGSGALTPLRAGLIAELYGTRAYGSINGAVGLAGTLARTIAPIGTGFLAMTIGAANLFLIVAVLMLMGAGMFRFFVKPMSS